MIVNNRQVALCALFVALVPSLSLAQFSPSGMTLLAVASQVEATAEEKPPTASEALDATNRILTIWPELVGTLPAGDPRYNAEDIGHAAFSSGIGSIGKSVMERRMAAGLKECGVVFPDDALKWPEDKSPRLADKDDNGGKKRNLTRAKLEALKTDGDIVKAYFAAMEAKTGVKMPRNPQGMAVKDWERVKMILRGASLLGR